MTQWWNQNVEKRFSDFKSWTGESNQPSKVYCRKYIADKQYKTLIDCGCGLATDYFAFKDDGHEIDYTGLDSCKYLVELNRKQGIAMLEEELDADLSPADNAYDCVYCREVLEHLPYYEKTISEFVRIASKEVIIVFFIKPLEDHEWENEIANKIGRIKEEFYNQEYKKFLAAHEARLKIIEGLAPDEPHPEPIEFSVTYPEIVITDENKEINYWKSEDLYHNKYDKDKLEKFIMSLPKVEKLSWVKIDDFGYATIPDDAENIDSQATVKSTPDLTNNKFILHILLK